MNSFRVGQSVYILWRGTEYKGTIWSIGTDYATVQIYTTEPVLVTASIENLRKWNRG